MPNGYGTLMSPHEVLQLGMPIAGAGDGAAASTESGSTRTTTTIAATAAVSENEIAMRAFWNYNLA
jgi:hypothetical protein